MWRNLASNVLTLLIAGLVVLAGVILWGRHQYEATGPLTQPICLQVPSRGSMSGVAADLEAQHAVSNGTIYRLGAQYSGKSKDLKAGSFLIEPGASMADIVAAITGSGVSTCGTEVIYRVSVNGQSIRVRKLDPVSQEFQVVAEFDPAAGEAPEDYTTARKDVGTRYRVVIAEGVTSWRVVEALKASDIFAGEVAEVPAEGSLAPDGYDVKVGQDRAEFLSKLEESQAKRLADAWANRGPDTPVKTPEEALILASIVEKETGIATERPLVASVFANRLKGGIRLQTDPTVIYGLTKGQGVLGRGLRQSELRKETPYNTYVVDGLPPTPICNPGVDSILAAISPAASDYIYFVAKTLDPAEGHVFSATLAEHNQNVAKLRALEAAAKNGQ